MKQSRPLVFTGIFLIAMTCLAAAAPGLSAQEESSELVRHFTWREIGPANCGGRITDIEGVPGNTKIVYAGAATGGVWKTVNNGITWEPIFNDSPNASIGDIAVSPSRPDIVYVGTGEANNRNSSPWGAGVFKTTDGGKTWAFLGLKETRHIGRIRIHPGNPDIAYVAALGHLWGVNPERGVFKTTDGGRNWEKILFLDERTGVTDLDMDPENPDILYAAAHERLRDRFDAGDPVDQWGPKAGIYISKDGGATWNRATEGLPAEEMGRIGIAAAPSRPGTVYAWVSTKKTNYQSRETEHKAEKLDPELGGIFKSTDFGASWVQTNIYHNRPSYYSQIRVDPVDADTIWLCGSPLGYSEDGGVTVRNGLPVQGRTHIDYHALWIDPADPEHVWLGGDGGLNITYDRGKNWEMIREIGLAQFYAITADMRRPYYVYGGLQDNGNWGGPSRSRRGSGILNSDWFPLSNADGFVCQVDPTDFNTVYFETQTGYAQRLDLRTGTYTFIRPRETRPKPGVKRERYRFDWNTPLLISPHNPHTLFMGGNKLFKSVDRGDHWNAISPDLTADPEGRTTAIVSMDESPLLPGLIWAGTNDGNLQLTRNGGADWTLLNGHMTEAPAKYWIKRVEASHHEEGRAYVVFDGHRHDDFAPYIFMTDDFGKTWTKIIHGLPEGSVYVVREDDRNPDLLFAGTEFAVYFSLDRGRNWDRFMNGLPTVPVHDLLIHPRDHDLIAGTHGRGAWIADNIDPLRQMTPEVREKDVYLFEIRPELMLNGIYEWTWVPEKRFFKSQPEPGSSIFYHLKSAAAEAPALEIVDITGEVVRNLEGTGKAGLNRVFWDFRKNPPRRAGPSRTTRYRRRAPMVEPGTYLVRLKVGGEVYTRTLLIEKDPPGYLGR